MHFEHIDVVKRLFRQIVTIAREQQTFAIGRNIVQMHTLAAIGEALRKAVGEIHQIERTAIAPTRLAIVGSIELFERPVGGRSVFTARNDRKLRRGRQRERAFGQSRGKCLLIHRGRVEHHEVRAPVRVTFEIQPVGFRHPRAVQVFGRAEQGAAVLEIGEHRRISRDTVASCFDIMGQDITPCGRNVGIVVALAVYHIIESKLSLIGHIRAQYIQRISRQTHIEGVARMTIGIDHQSHFAASRPKTKVAVRHFHPIQEGVVTLQLRSLQTSRAPTLSVYREAQHAHRVAVNRRTGGQTTQRLLSAFFGDQRILFQYFCGIKRPIGEVYTVGRERTAQRKATGEFGRRYFHRVRLRRRTTVRRLRPNRRCRLQTGETAQ